MRIAFATLLALLAFAVPASAQVAVGDAVQGLRSDPVYVAPGADPGLTPAQADALRAKLRGGTYVAVLPPGAFAGTNAEAVAERIREGLRRDGTYAVASGREFGAGSTTIEGVGTLANDVVANNQDGNLNTLLTDFATGLGDLRSGGGGDGGGSAGAGALVGILAVLLVGGGSFAWFSSRRTRQRRAGELEDLRTAARDDLVALGDDVRAVDAEPVTDPVARQHLETALTRYDEADTLLRKARRADAFATISSTIEEGRFAMACAQAHLRGEPEPEHRPPCFFDPRHGPSVTDVTWAPPDGGPRDVPVCAADAARLADGAEPISREVVVAGQRMPYWQAPGYFSPWASGFYGTGLLPGLFIGSALAGGWSTDAGASGGDWGGGDFGGGGFGGGDFGGGGGDFGGGGF